MANMNLNSYGIKAIIHAIFEVWKRAREDTSLYKLIQSVLKDWKKIMKIMLTLPKKTVLLSLMKTCVNCKVDENRIEGIKR